LAGAGTRVRPQQFLSRAKTVAVSYAAGSLIRGMVTAVSGDAVRHRSIGTELAGTDECSAPQTTMVSAVVIPCPEPTGSEPDGE
jgi:hypothetical protein